MKRRMVYGILAFLLAATLACAVGVGWVVGTTAGTRWFLKALSSSTSLKVTARTVEGRMLNNLRLERVHIRWPQGDMEIGRVRFRWQPLFLLAGEVAVKELTLQEVRIQDNAPEVRKPPDLSWPKVSGIPAQLAGWVDLVRLNGLTYRRLDQTPVVINEVSTVLTWRDTFLTLGNLVVDTPDGRIAGKVVSGFRRPSLLLDLSALPVHPMADLNRLLLQARLFPARGAEQVAGKVALVGIAGVKHSVELTGEVGVTRHSFNLKHLRLTRPGRKGTVSGRGELRFTADEPLVHFEATLADLDLAPEFSIPTSLSGNLLLDGSPGRYGGRFTLSNRGAEWRTASLSGSFQGTGEGINLTDLAATLLDGTMRGNLRIGWREGIVLDGALQARKLNPAKISSEWEGVVNLDLEAKARRSGKTPLQGEVNGRLLESHLRGKILMGKVEARFSQDNLIISRLFLAGDGFDLHAAGELKERLAFTARIGDLSTLVPKVKGELQAAGWVRWSEKRLSGAITGRGRELAANGVRIAATELAARIEQDKGYIFQGKAALHGVVYNRLRADAAALEVNGAMQTRMPEGDRLILSGKASATGAVTVDGHRVTVQQSQLQLGCSERGMRAVMELRLAEGGMLKGRFSSSGPARLAIPGEGEFAAEWQGFDLALLHLWLPRELDVQGGLSGRLLGKLLPGSRLDIKGNAAISQGKMRWGSDLGEINVAIGTADLTWGWKGETLSGDISLSLVKHGQARGSFQLPLPARFPVAMDQKGPVRASFTGRVQEMGLLAALFPGLVQESHGELGFDVRAGGRWEKPQLEGSLALSKAGAYLPSAGIRLKDLLTTVRLEKDEVRIDSLQVKSGPGHMGGNAVIRLKGWGVASYRGSISGERFQTVYLPELQLLSTPRLTFEGTPEKLTVRGELRLPELFVYGPKTRAPIQPSKDVILEGTPRPAAKKPLLALDVQVRVLLGDRVFVKAEGIDAQLGGNVDLVAHGLDRIVSKGEIRVVKGDYRAYGVDLKIVRGRVFYAGGPIDRPTLDILALRTVGDVRAGVTIAGTPQVPVIKLYSEPAMPDVDIMAYMVLGHPLGQSGEQASLMMQAAGFLLSTSQSVVLQEQMKRRLGVDTLAIETAGGKGTGGYKVIPVTPPGTAPAQSASGGISQTMLTVGKYLTPKLYVSYGRSLFTNGNLFKLRYDITKRWQIETQTGSESGGDIYYKVDFD